jgi:penicillin-binding protein 2
MANVPVTVGSKTGTAEKTGYADYAMFVCAAPYDAPEIVVSVRMEKGSSGGYAAYTAARILETYYRDEEAPAAGTENPHAITRDSQSGSSGAVG